MKHSSKRNTQKLYIVLIIIAMFTIYKIGYSAWFSSNLDVVPFLFSDNKAPVAAVTNQRNRNTRVTVVTYPFEITGLPSGTRVRIMNIKPAYRPKIQLAPGSYDVELTLPDGEVIRGWLAIDASLHVFKYKGG